MTVNRLFTGPGRIWPLALALATPIGGIGQALLPTTGPVQLLEPMTWQSKLKYHAKAAYGPEELIGLAVYSGYLQASNSPTEWGGGAGAYGKRLLSAAGGAGIHSVLAFGLDTSLHQDPRYFRSGAGGFWGRSAHALRGTLLTRTDSGGETISTWRIGSAYGSAFLDNTWYPARLNTVKLGFAQGSIRLGFDLASNLGAEFWPDIKRHVFHK